MYYCGSNPTALTSQEQTSGALLRLMARKPYSSISVSELCREAGISRQTFYSLFSSMENVVLFTLQEKACELPCTGAEENTLDGLCRCYSQYICRNRDILKLFVENGVGYLVYNSFYDSFSRFCGCGEAEDSRKASQYDAHFLAGGLTGVVREYCTAEPKGPAEDLYETLVRLFRGQFFRYL